MSKPFEVVRREYVTPNHLSPRTLLLSPLDVNSGLGTTYIGWPFLFDYDIDANRLTDALRTLCITYPFLCGRALPHEDTRHIIEVGTQSTVTYGIPFAELKADMTIATAYLEHSQIKNASADFPSNPETPFLMERFNREALIKGEIPLVSVRLIHFSNGCALTITISHLLTDGQRYIELYGDLSRIYRGEDIPERSFDRSAFWPDQFVKHYTFLGEEVANMPRKTATPEEKVDVRSYPGEMCNVEALYFSKVHPPMDRVLYAEPHVVYQDVLNGMKEAIQPLLAEGEFVSTNDVLVGFAWMVNCELIAEEEFTEDNFWSLVSDTMGAVAVELLRNGVQIVPENFSGNAFVFPYLAANEADVKGKSFLEILAQLALTMRRTVAAIQTQPPVAAQILLTYYTIVYKGVIPVDTLKGRLLTTNVAKMPIAAVDFGQGSPKIVHAFPAFPFSDIYVTMGNAPGSGQGMILQMVVPERSASRFKNSKIIKACASGVKYFYSEFTAHDVEAMIEGK